MAGRQADRLRSADFGSVVDGAVYGAMAGLGFATLENAVFVGLPVIRSAGAVTLADAAGVATGRMLAGPVPRLDAVAGRRLLPHVTR